MRRFFGIWKEKAKKSRYLSENEIMALLQLMFDLGIQYSKVSLYNWDLDSYIKKFYNKFSSTRGLQLVYFLESLMTLDATKKYKPKELNKIISTNFRNYVPNELNKLGLVNDEQLISIKEDINLIHPRDLTELLQIMTDDLKILEKVDGIKNKKEKQDSEPGRKKNKEITNYEGYPSLYKLSTEFIFIKNLLKKPESCDILRNYINKNQLLKNYLIFNLTTIHLNSSQLMNKKIKPEDKERLRYELNKNINTKQEDLIHILYLGLLFTTKEEIKNYSHKFIEAILSTNDYTYILFLIKLSSLLNKIKIKNLL